jgi:hypothetical protein
MLETVALILSIAAYAAFYAGAPGRQSRPVGPPRLLLGMGTALTLAALVMAALATGPKSTDRTPTRSVKRPSNPPSSPDR